MNTPVRLALITVLAAAFFGCATEEEARRRDSEIAKKKARENYERAKEDEREEREDRARDRRNDEEDFQDFLGDYAYDLRKTKSQLTSAERAAARREYNEGSRSRSSRWRRGYGYWY